jgi:ribosomal protein S18 acetylase RimI-like enzyme
MRLKSSDIGQRVVVRTTVANEIGPSGGPALTDTLGHLESWSDTTIGVRKADGTLITIAMADVVAAKVVPPTVQRAMRRVSDEELERVAAAGWIPPVTSALGDWLLRAAGGFTGRANSALVIGDPGIQLIDALDAVRSFYADHRLPTRAQVIVDSAWDGVLIQQGWFDDRPLDGGVAVQAASLAAALRLGRQRRSASDTVTILPTPTSSWIARYGRADETDAGTLKTLLMSGDEVGFAQLGDPVTAIGRASTSGDWVGLFAVTVDPSQRRRGLGSAIVLELLDWAAEHGAMSAYLQVAASNAAGLSLYESFGFETHHRYHYLQPPSTTSGD